MYITESPATRSCFLAWTPSPVCVCARTIFVHEDERRAGREETKARGVAGVDGVLEVPAYKRRQCRHQREMQTQSTVPAVVVPSTDSIWNAMMLSFSHALGFSVATSAW
jgi:hypothetical protein